MVQEISQTKNDIAAVRQNTSNTIRRVQEAANIEVENIRKSAQEEIENTKKMLDRSEQENEYLRGLNSNLLRISRERANADRKLRPKKEHTGYVVVSSVEKEYRYKKNRSKTWTTVTLWETVLQSPYSVEFTEEQARKQMRELLEGKRESWLIGRLGITGYFPGKYEDMIEIPVYSQRNTMFSIRLRANYRSGYWEVSFSHTQPLGVVPENMRIR